MLCPQIILCIVMVKSFAQLSHVNVHKLKQRKPNPLKSDISATKKYNEPGTFKPDENVFRVTLFMSAAYWQLMEFKAPSTALLTL